VTLRITARSSTPRNEKAMGPIGETRKGRPRGPRNNRFSGSVSSVLRHGLEGLGEHPNHQLRIGVSVVSGVVTNPGIFRIADVAPGRFTGLVKSAGAFHYQVSWQKRLQ
jgi:hypothetical protein